MKQNDRQPNAQKWTTEVVTEHLQEIEKDVAAGNSYFLGRALIKRGLYSQIWKYWKEVFVEYDDITETMLRIETMLEANLLDAALKKELSPYVAMLTLKNNYHWRDRPVSEVAEKEPEVIAEPQVFRPDTNYKAYLTGGEVLEVMDLEELERTLKQNAERPKQ